MSKKLEKPTKTEQIGLGLLGASAISIPFAVSSPVISGLAILSASLGGIALATGEYEKKLKDASHKKKLKEVL
jgi:hypothetical protein